MTQTICCPLYLAMLLHFHCYPRPYAEHEPEHASYPAVADGMDFLLSSGMIEPADDYMVFRTTNRGRAYVEHLMTVPFPVQQWVMP